MTNYILIKLILPIMSVKIIITKKSIKIHIVFIIKW